MEGSLRQFEQRKKDHIRWAMDPSVQSLELRDWDRVELVHEALPDLNFQEVSTKTSFTLGSQKLNFESPVFISSMTAGHKEGIPLNERLAFSSASKQILMGVGSQRRELSDSEASQEWKDLRKKYPKALLMGNLGISQLMESRTDQILKIVDNLEALGLFIHLNPLQEALQPEGTPFFRGGLKALKDLVQRCPVPVVVKETGCGFSENTLQKLKDVGIAAVDVAGAGGTHWGRLEGFRSSPEDNLYKAAQTFGHWGISTLESLLNGLRVGPEYKIWASGGVRNGLDAAKALALGAQMVGIGQPFLEAALLGEEALLSRWELLQKELKVALFCTGCCDLNELVEKKVWKWQNN